MSDRSDWFPHATLAAATIALGVAGWLALTAGGGDPTDAAAPPVVGSAVGSTPAAPAEPVDLDDGAVADPDADPADIVADAAPRWVPSRASSSARPRGRPCVRRPVRIDRGRRRSWQFTVPTRPRRPLDVTVDGNLRTPSARCDRRRGMEVESR